MNKKLNTELRKSPNKKYYQKLLNILCLLTFTFAWTSANHVQAGSFHYEIDVMTQLLSSQNNKLNTVQMSWLYDEKMSKMLLQDEDITPAKRQQTLNTVGDLIMTDLPRIELLHSNTGQWERIKDC